MRQTPFVMIVLTAFVFVFSGPTKVRAESVAEFLKRCKTLTDICEGDIDGVSDVLQFVRNDKNFCPPDLSKISNNAVIANWAAILKWLREHPDGKDADIAIADGWRARYPCAKR